MFGFLMSNTGNAEVKENCKRLKDAYPDHFDEFKELEFEQFFKFSEKPLNLFVATRDT